jgi:hypothetical protein
MSSSTRGFVLWAFGLAAVAAEGSLAGCRAKPDAATTETTSAEVEDARSPEGFARAKKVYIASMEAKLAETDRRLSALDDRASDVGETKRSEIKSAIRAARAKRDIFRLDVRSLAYGQPESWAEDRAVLDREYDELRASLDRIEQHF